LQSNLTPEGVEILASEILVDDGNDIIDLEETMVVDVE
jgi:hypothetical protein